MIASLIALVMTLLWYLVDRQREKKQPNNQPIGHYQGVIRKNSLDAYKLKISEKQPDADGPFKTLGRVYYSTPGQTYIRFIWKGRILNSGKTWPYPPNTR